MTPARQLTVATAACAAGAGLALWAASRTWLVTQTVRPAPLPPVSTPQSGGSLAPLLPALALVALACAGGLLATRGLARSAVGVVMALAGIGVGVAAIRTATATSGGWPALAVAGAALVLLAAGLTLARGRQWPAMGARYERPAATARVNSATGMWDAIDRGDDPTEPASQTEPDRETEAHRPSSDGESDEQG